MESRVKGPPHSQSEGLGRRPPETVPGKCGSCLGPGLLTCGSCGGTSSDEAAQSPCLQPACS